MTHSLWLGSALAITAVLAGSVVAQPRVPSTMPEKAQLQGQEQHPTAKIESIGPHDVYVVDPVFPHLVASKIYMLDGDTLRFRGMFNTGYLPNLVLPEDKSQIYAAETYWSRGTRGERSDIVTFFDPHTLEVTGEVPLPKGRFLVVPKTPDLALTRDGHFLLSYNMDPSTSVSLVDVKARKYLGELQTPGCGQIYPTGDRSFAMLCPDGSFNTLKFDDNGKSQLLNGKPFFDSDHNPLFEHPAEDRQTGKAYFISYDGTVYPVDFSSEQPQIGTKWKLQGQGEDAWRPGGWQLAVLHAPTNRLFVAMHEGGAWTHMTPGKEIWVFDLGTHSRIRRIPTKHDSMSLLVTQDNQPLLFTVSEDAVVSVFDATTYQPKGEKSSVGDSPYLLQQFGQ
jgi:methylamine dehydrogenase heavy chain